MKYVDEFRNGNLAGRMATEITNISKGQKFKFMEVCGGHTHTIFKHGIEDILPENIELIHGPGCPVCVLPMGCLLYTSPSPRDLSTSRMPSSA